VKSGSKYLCFVIVASLNFVSTSNSIPQESQQKEKETPVTQEKLEKIFEEVKKEAKEVEGKRVEDDALEIDGLVIDETKTKIGRDFYDLFYSLWEAPQGTKGYTIYIYERALPQSGSWVWITVNETMVYQNVLRPRYDVIEEASRMGIDATKYFLYRMNQDQRQLSGEDMAGTGIY